MKKGQTALEFLMTYGWAILIVAIVGAVLWRMGVFNPGRFMGSQYSGFDNLVIEDWAIDNGGNLTLSLAYTKSGRAMTVESGNATSIDCSGLTEQYDDGPNNATGDDSAATSADTSVNISAGQTKKVWLDTATRTVSAGTRCRIDYTITYTDQDSGITHSSTGTFRGKLG